MGLRRADFLGKPVIAILNSWSDLSPCHSHLRDRADAVKRGVWQAGGFPVELPVLSVGEVMVKPTTMLYRNFLAMEAEEVLRSHPVDGVVLLGGCDKSTPGMLMGALSMDLPTIFCPAGPMSSGRWRGQRVGAGTHTMQFWQERRSGHLSAEEWVDLEQPMTRSIGTCNTMGTASTMTTIVDAMGLTLPGASSIPAADAAHPRMAADCGARIVEMVREDLRPSRILSRESFLNGAVAYMAMGGSTNAAIHLIAMAGRAGVKLDLDDMDAVSKKVAICANLFPAGSYLMEEFHFAGGLKALLNKMLEHLVLDCPTVNGQTLGQNIAGATCWDDDVIRGPENPVIPLDAGRTLVVVRGNLAPEGAVLKSSSATPALLRHEGPALVFDHPDAMVRALDDPDLDVDDNTVIVLRNAGPIGAPGMPEWGNLPIPKRQLMRGVRDMVRISDARMSGTHYGTCILHVSPEAAAGGGLALIRTGDIVRLDAAAGRLDMLVPDDELGRRRQEWKQPASRYGRSYTRLYQEHVQQAHEGCDFDFLTGTEAVPEPEIF